MSDTQPRAASANRYVAFADVLGFRALVKANTHQMLMNIFGGDVLLAAEFGATGGTAAPGRPDVPDPDLALVNMRLISDSIVLWTDGSRPPEFAWLVLAVRRLLSVGIGTGVPLRAAITYGELSHFERRYPSSRVSADTVVGRALVDAYEIEGSQQWSGGLIAPAAVRHYDQTRSADSPSIGDLERQRVVVVYDVPMTGPTRRESLAVNWVSALDGELGEGHVRWSFSEYGKSVDDPSTAEKLSNTIEFLSAMRKSERP